MNKTYVLIAAAVILAAGSWWYYTSLNIETARNDTLPPKPLQRGHEESPPPETAEVSAHGGEDALAVFTCAGGKSMTAVFSRDLVDLTLSDGRQLTLTQAVSGSGIRYTNASETIEFRSKGDDATLQEGSAVTFDGCVLAR